MAKEAWFINESELDDFQIRVIRRKLQSSFIVKGCAGSGKTVLALWRAKELQEQGIKDYLVIVFTKALKKFIEDGIKSIGIDESRVMYYHEWNMKGSPAAEYIIADEVQDFDENELNKIKSAARKHLILFGDSAQQLYKDLPGKGRLFTMEEIQVKTQIPMENLVINHRLPKKIARVAEFISLSGDPLTERCNKEGVNKPRLVEANSLEEQLNFIMDVVKAQKYTDVGILFPKNEDVQMAKNYFDRKNWKVEAKIGMGPDSMDLDFKSEYPKLMTYHSSKGLQFEAVFIPNCNISLETFRNPLYVAITRSYRDLFILYNTGQLSPFISSIDKSLFDYIKAK